MPRPALRGPPAYTRKDAYGSLPTQYDMVVKGTALVGTLCGQLIFGLLGDRLGRKAPYGWTLMIMVIGETRRCSSEGPAIWREGQQGP